MINNINFISIREVMSRILDHPLLQDVTIEQAVRYTLDFINIVGYPQIYDNKLTDVKIENYRGTLPCDCVQVVQVMGPNRITLKSMTDNFMQLNESIPAYKIQGRCIYVTFEDCIVKVAYRGIKVDDMGFPMIPDTPIFLKALELYIKCQAFTIQFDMNKISQAVLQHTEREYAWAVGQLNSEMNLPNEDEMEVITNMFNQLIPNLHLNKEGFLHLGDSIRIK